MHARRTHRSTAAFLVAITTLVITTTACDQYHVRLRRYAWTVEVNPATWKPGTPYLDDTRFTILVDPADARHVGIPETLALTARSESGGVTATVRTRLEGRTDTFRKICFEHDVMLHDRADNSDRVAVPAGSCESNVEATTITLPLPTAG